MMAAAAGMMLAACSEDNLQVANTPQQAVSDVAVGFDTYLSQSNKTRAGMTDVMTNAKLQKSQAEEGGFGVFAVQHNGSISAHATAGVGNWATAKAANRVTPNFMWNQGVFYAASAWSYTPLKYWPNETFNDSQETPAYSQETAGTTKDKVSFFAYAPYVNFNAGVGSNYPSSTAVIKYNGVNAYTTAGGSSSTTGSETPALTGIMAVTGNTFSTDAPKVYYKVNSNGATTDKDRKPEESVDLLWGVAPAGGLNYTAVNGEAVSIKEGMPLYDLQKPGENEKVKFLFQHALSRLSLTIVAAVDQIGAGGTLTDASGNVTKINVEEVKVKANKFNTEGWLDLNNEYKNRAKWEYTGSPEKYTNNSTNDWLFIMQDGTINGEIGTGSTVSNNKLLNETIWDNGGTAATQPEGVTVSEKNVMAAQVDPDKIENNGTSYEPVFKYGTSEWLKNANGNAEEAEASYTTADDAYYKKDGDSWVNVASGQTIKLKGSSTERYNKITIGSEVTAGNSLQNGTKYYTYNSTTKTYTWAVDGTGSNTYTSNVYPIEDGTTIESDMKYSAAVYYSGTQPRYWMVIPAYYDDSADPKVQSTNVTVQITYYVTTDDANLADGKSRVQNIIEKTVPVSFESGKSYNLKLILGLTSVKLAAEVSDWKLAGDTEVNLPQNVE